MSYLEIKTLQAASEAFATQRLPENWFDLSDDDQNEWLENNRWYHFENDTNDEFFALIDTHADSIKDAVDDVLNMLKEKLVKTAIGCKLPVDFKELDLKSLLEGEL